MLRANQSSAKSKRLSLDVSSISPQSSPRGNSRRASKVVSQNMETKRNKFNSRYLDTASILTTSDWSLLLQGAKTLTFPPDTILIDENVKPRQLFQIIKGQCTVERWIEGQHITVATRGPGEIFGEVCFLDGSDSQIGATARVVTTTPVEVYALGEHFVTILLGVHPDLAPRFYRYLFTMILQKHLEQTGYSEQEEEDIIIASEEKARLA
eukprot:TRINITY_DN14635_c0_g1_i1.p1 TRINITY_DN14635_c0_g1~~TRINITY_DN14635_c0_g1_i1.p1  ORF type:complete len:210 (+),score=32.36 TRINITY_DN14635_c0_g1_i1:208-837(+)